MLGAKEKLPAALQLQLFASARSGLAAEKEGPRARLLTFIAQAGMRRRSVKGASARMASLIFLIVAGSLSVLWLVFWGARG